MAYLMIWKRKKEFYSCIAGHHEYRETDHKQFEQSSFVFNHGVELKLSKLFFLSSISILMAYSMIWKIKKSRL